MTQKNLQRRLIGEVLIERELITHAQLEQALREQAASVTKEYIGDILVRLGYVTDQEIVIALVVQCNLPYIAVSRYEIAPDVVALIPAEVAWGSKIVPLDRIGVVLSVVMLNPLDEQTQSDVERMTGCQIATFISTRSEIETALRRLYPQQE